MKHFIVKSLNILTIVLLCCTLLCGAWVATHEITDLSFHATLSAVSVIVAIISEIVSLCKCRFCNNK